MKDSIARRKTWAAVPKDERIKRMSALGKKSIAKMTPLQLKKRIRKMVNAKNKNRT